MLPACPTAEIRISCTVWAQLHIIPYLACIPWDATLPGTFPSWYYLMWKKQLSNLTFCHLQSLKSYSLRIWPGNVKCLQAANKRRDQQAGWLTHRQEIWSCVWMLLKAGSHLVSQIHTIIPQFHVRISRGKLIFIFYFFPWDIILAWFLS